MEEYHDQDQIFVLERRLFMNLGDSWESVSTSSERERDQPRDDSLSEGVWSTGEPP